MAAMTSTVYSGEFGDADWYDSILAYLDGDDTHTDYERGVLADALFDALCVEVGGRLGDDVLWQSSTSQFLHRVDVDVPGPDEMRELFVAAWDAVAGRYDQIERELFGVLPVTMDGLGRQLRAIGDPVRRARVAGLLVDAGMRQMAGTVRAEAVYEATRNRNRVDVAELLGTGVPAVGKLVAEHNRRG